MDSLDTNPEEKTLLQEYFKFLQILNWEILHDNKGYLEMSLPFRVCLHLPKNKHLAEVHPKHLKAKIGKKSQIWKRSNQIFGTHFEWWRCKRSIWHTDDDSTWYIPHHGVYCDTMGWVRQLDYLFICFGAKPKQRPDLEISDKTGSGGGKEGPRGDRGQLAKEPREGQLAKGDAERQSTRKNRGERSALSWLCREWQSQKSERRLLKPDELHGDRVNQHKKMSALLAHFVEVSSKIHVSVSLQMHGECKVTQNSLSCAWSWHKPILFVCSFFSHSLGCISFVVVKKCELPRQTH